VEVLDLVVYQDIVELVVHLAHLDTQVRQATVEHRDIVVPADSLEHILGQVEHQDIVEYQGLVVTSM